MRQFFKRFFILTIASLLLANSNSIFAQSVAITDDDAYSPNASAMLDVMSTDKGMLVPRMNTLQRLAIGTPAIGLMVYDTDFNNFFYYNGITWMGLPQVGVSGFGGPLFHVINSYGDTIFAVYDDGVQIIVPQGVKGKVGGFAISGRSPAKGTIDDYLVITPDSARIYINDTVTSKGKVGGFAISGRSPAKGTENDIFFATVDSTRIYVDETNSKGKVGGFAISGRSPAKATTSSFLNLSSKNYFIGHQSGLNITTGLYNTFFGYQSGIADSTGSNNVFIGYQSGNKNTTGHSNIFIGESSGKSNTTAPSNIFIGKEAGLLNTSGYQNVFIGEKCGQKNETGHSNTFIGRLTGGSNASGTENVYIGLFSGVLNIEGSKNTFLGTSTGQNNTGGTGNTFLGYKVGFNELGSNKLYIDNSDISTPLIYGEFDNRNVVIDGDANDNPGGYKFAVTGEAGAVAWLNLGKKSEFNSTSDINNSLSKITQLNGINYSVLDKNGNNTSQIGINPESAIKIIPDVVKDFGEYYSIDYSKISVLLIEAMKEQQIQINNLQNFIDLNKAEKQKTNQTNQQINLLIEENIKLKKDIAEIKDLLKSVLKK